ncbi:GntR family transcriptional regulator [Marinagarivorans algicola]|uniref:GntR family transcriptional regulator n=1 Tax=Marinagarivorans algicola TaxID=1513270 RepID=UPI0006B639D4|nr:GntR family transcriptional regulator [Marinagarivorans algicola]
MPEQWNDSQPIYRQLRDKMVGLILEGALIEGESIPSVRTVSSEYKINHLTVSKAYQSLVDEGLLEKRRGLGMFVLTGARQRILQAEKTQFLTVELPQLVMRLSQLGISPNELITHLQSLGAQATSGEKE